ncbi:hypothetical protein [Pseudomonas japonica]|uniref:Uncharacterized protein n=1 Tax=Pseudomonas japonica TaxID=256466 RepID=A0A239CJP4_9PSED|nr:hypothetical protein [Pseudomonas japonica]SNS19918.1 hypothetical protein SAMN05444352_104227 [Pseudomonas japonica]
MLPTLLRYLLLLLATLPGLQSDPAISAEDPGRSVVHRLQQRFDDTRAQCEDSSAAYNCSGVIIRAIRDPSNPTFWNPSPENVARKGVSFSFIRADVGNERLAGDAGLIMRELHAPTEQPLVVRCAFPANAGTDSRIESCGTEQFPLPCHLSGITDIPTWQAHFAQYTGTGSCYFEPDAQWFHFSIEARRHFPHPGLRAFWNEIIIEPWPQDIPERLPIEALYYSGDAVDKARQMQDSFIRATGKFIPVVRVELTRDPVFYYSPKDQAVQPPRMTGSQGTGD